MVTQTLQARMTVEQLRVLGFSDAKVDVPRRLIASVSGREKSGKTHFSLTAPGPILFFNIDIGTEGVVGKFQEQGKQVLVYDVRVPKRASQDTYATMWADFKQRVEAVYRLGRGTVVYDTATEAYELNRLARFGKLTQVAPHNYVEVNNEWREFMRLSYDATSMNTVFVHKMKPKWVDNRRTSEYEVAGMGEIQYLVQANVLVWREDVREEEGNLVPKFSALVQDCRQNPNLCGTVLTGPMFDFNFLLTLVHGKGK